MLIGFVNSAVVTRILFAFLYFTSILCLAQEEQSIQSGDSLTFAVGDIIVLGQPSDSLNYNSIAYTFETARSLQPELEESDYEKIYLPAEFLNAQFTITEIDSSMATMAYDTISNFALMDLELAVENDEIGIVNPSDELASISSDSLLSIAIANLEIAQQPEIDSAALLAEQDSILRAQRREIARLDSIAYADSIANLTLFQRLQIKPYFFPLIEMTPEFETSLAYGGGIGVIFREKWQMGVYIQKYDPGFTKRVVFPSVFIFDYTYAGLYGGYQVWNKGKVQLLIESKFGVGEAAWSQRESGAVLDTDNFMVINPRISLDYMFTNYSILNIAAGYRIIGGLDLVTMDSNALNNFTLSATLKLGWFK